MAETIDTILERMLLQIPSRYDTSSGTYTYDIEKSTAMEFENVYDIISSLDSYFYASTATGKYLDMRVGEFGLERKDASYATGCVTVSGNVGAKVSVGEKVAAGNIIFNITENAVIPSEGSVTVQVVCDSAGVKGNVEKGKINRFPVTIQGLVSVTNEISTTGGSDKEGDVELRKRFTEYVSHPITSGNKWQYISWAKSKYGGYSYANAVEFSTQQAQRLGWDSYGDTQYPAHVLRYYPYGRAFTAGGNQAIVEVALTQVGNQGGQPYWSWYGFDSRVEWCACFVSWCADQCGYIESGLVPKFAGCVDGANWFKSNGKWQNRTYEPKAGDIIFFDWEGDGTTDHVGIVEKCENGTVYTVEGNSGDACKQRQYAVGSSNIYGYGIPAY